MDKASLKKKTSDEDEEEKKLEDEEEDEEIPQLVPIESPDKKTKLEVSALYILSTVCTPLTRYDSFVAL